MEVAKSMTMKHDFQLRTEMIDALKQNEAYQNQIIGFERKRGIIQIQSRPDIDQRIEQIVVEKHPEYVSKGVINGFLNFREQL